MALFFTPFFQVTRAATAQSDVFILWHSLLSKFPAIIWNHNDTCFCSYVLHPSPRTAPMLSVSIIFTTSNLTTQAMTLPLYIYLILKSLMRIGILKSCAKVDWHLGGFGDVSWGGFNVPLWGGRIPLLRSLYLRGQELDTSQTWKLDLMGTIPKKKIRY